MKTAKVSNSSARVSLKDSVLLLKQIRHRPVKKAGSYLERLITKKDNLGGKYYTGASTEILKLLKDLENNAENNGLNADKLFITHATVNKSFKFMLPKSRWTHRGRKAKICQLEIEAEER